MDVKWIDFFTQLGFSTAGQILLLIVVGFFGKKIIEYFLSENIELMKTELNMELESHKIELASQTQTHKLELDKNLETFKNTLQQVSYEHQIKFSKLHSDRAEIIKILFSKLVIMEKSMNSFMAPFQRTGEPSLTDKSQKAANDANDFLDYYLGNEILFKEETCQIINTLNDSFKKAWNSYNTFPVGKVAPTLVNEEKRIELTMKAYFDFLNKEVPSLKQQLKDDFRKTLGVI
jgi:hypothetical protein